MSSSPAGFIAGTGIALPAGRLPVALLADREGLGPPERAVLARLGVETVAEADPAAMFSLQVSAAEDALVAAGIEGGALDALVVVASRAPERLMTSEATRLQHALGAGRALTLSVGDLGCAAMAAALEVGMSLLSAHPGWSYVLVAHSSAPAGPRRYRHPVTVNGDGACAVVLGRSGPWKMEATALETNGEYWDLYSIDYRDRPDADWVEACSDLRKYSFGLAVESRNRFRELIARVGGSELVSTTLLQHLSQPAFDLYEEALGLEVAAGCRVHTRELGHLGSMDTVLDLHSLTAESVAGGRVLALANSPVAAWAAMVFSAT